MGVISVQRSASVFIRLRERGERTLHHREVGSAMAAVIAALEGAPGIQVRR